MNHNGNTPCARESVPGVRSSQWTEKVVPELVPLSFEHDVANDAIFECRGDRCVTLEGALLYRRIAENCHGVIHDVLALVKNHKLKVDPVMGGICDNSVLAIVAYQLLHNRAQRELRHQFLVGAIRSMLTGRAPLSRDLRVIVADKAMVTRSVVVHMNCHRSKVHVEKVVEKVEKKLPPTLEERVHAYLDVVGDSFSAASLQLTMMTLLSKYSAEQLTVDLRFCALNCATDPRFDGVFRRMDPSMMILCAGFVDAIVRSDGGPYGRWKPFEAMVSGSAIDHVGIGVSVVGPRLYRDMGIHGFFDHERVWSVEACWGEDRIHPVYGDEIHRASDPIVVINPDPYAYVKLKGLVMNPIRRNSVGLLETVGEAMVRCERPDHVAYQGFMFLGLVITFDIGSDSAVRWDSDKGEDYHTPVWEQNGLRIYAGRYPDDKSVLTPSMFRDWDKNEVSVLYESTEIEVSVPCTVVGTCGTVGYIKVDLPPVALGALCVNTFEGSVCGFVTGIGPGWGRIRFLPPCYLDVVRDVIDSQTCPAVIVSCEMNGEHSSSDACVYEV